MEAILIPVKRLESAKQRLAGHIQEADRVSLGLAMITDILKSTQSWEHRFVVTDDPLVRVLAGESGATVIDDQGAGLNPAIQDATSRAMELGVTSLAILPCDVPLVAAADVSLLFQADAEIVIVPSGDGGTNALVRTPPDAIQPAFGPGSAAAHLEAAKQAGRKYLTMNLPSLTLDIDGYEDLVLLATTKEKGRSITLARRLVGAQPGTSPGKAAPAPGPS